MQIVTFNLETLDLKSDKKKDMILIINFEMPII